MGDRRDASQDGRIDCPLCGSGEPKAFIRDWKDYKLYDCPACGAGFCLPFKAPGAAYYAGNTDVYPHRAAETTDPRTSEYDECLSFLQAAPLKSRRLLDVGCGAGGFLNRARGLGFEVSGLDFNKARLEAIRSQLGIQSLYCGSLEDFAQSHPTERFDVVAMFQILEHLDDPARWVRAAASLLSPGGFFIVCVPDRDRTFDPFRGPGMDEIDNPPHHLTRWSVAALKTFVENQSLKVLDCKSLGVPRAMLAFILRHRLRLGLATRSLGVDEVQHARPEALTGAMARRARVMHALVAVKEGMIDAAAFLAYPFFLLAFRAFGWRGAALYCAARKPEA